MKWIEGRGKTITEYGWITLGCVITALAINVFLPFKIAPGGVTDGNRYISFKYGRFPVGLVMLVLNVPLSLLVQSLGIKFLVRTLFATFMLSAIDATAWPVDAFVRNYLATEGMNAYNPDLIITPDRRVHKLDLDCVRLQHR